MQHVKKAFLTLAIPTTFFLTGCGGGGGSSSDSTSDDSDTAVVKASPGAYYGDVTYTNDSTSAEVVAILAPDGTFVAGFDDGSYSRGKLTFSSDGFSGPFTDFYGTQRNSGTFEGTATKTTLNGQGIVGGQTVSNIEIQREATISDLNASAETIAGNWSETFDGVTTALTFLEDGSVTGSDTTGCTINGRFSVPDPDYNVYQVSVDVTGCGAVFGLTAEQRNGTYNGFGAIEPNENNGDPRTLVFATDNGKVPGLFLLN